MPSRRDAPAPALRRLSHIELFWSACHHMGIYRCVAVTCRYRPRSPAPGPSLTAATLYPALAAVVASQPMLRVGILGQETSKARFAHVKEVHLQGHVAFATIDCRDLDQYEHLVAEQQGWHHDQLWPDIETRPPWRVAVFQPVVRAARPGDATPQGLFQDVVFAFHHALMDGTSGRRFHELLLAALNRARLPPPGPPREDAACLLSFPEAPILPEAQQDVIPFKNSPPFVAKTIWHEFGPSVLRPNRTVPWHGKPVDFDIPHKTRVCPVDIPAAVVDSLVKACRRHATSLTGLFHALVLVSHALHLPADEAKSFAASTPISLRPCFGPKADPERRQHLRCLITSLAHRYPDRLVAELRRPDADLDSLVWQVARRVKGELMKKLASLPRDDLGGLMKYVGDWHDYLKKKNGKSRDQSWEVSNIGVLHEPAAAADDAAWSIARVLFTNGSVVAGAPLAVNIASAHNGGLTAAISWQDTVVPDKLVESIAGDIATYAAQIHETGHLAALA